jgi:hypothetical protein
LLLLAVFKTLVVLGKLAFDECELISHTPAQVVNIGFGG